MHILWSLWTIDVKPTTEARKAGFFMPGGQRMLCSISELAFILEYLALKQMMWL